MTPTKPLAAALLGAALALLAACGGGDPEDECSAADALRPPGVATAPAGMPDSRVFVPVTPSRCVSP